MIYKKDKIHFKVNYQIILLFISIILSSYGVLKSEVALYTIKNNPDFTIGETPTKICFYGLNSIISGKALSQYFSHDLFDYLKDNPSILNLSNDDKIIDVVFRDDICKVITKNEEQMRGFILPLEKSMTFPLYYQITTIKEDDIVSINTFLGKNNPKGVNHDSLSSN
jgi:hypothetical protein